MRRNSLIAILALVACIAGAAPRYVALETSIGTNAAEVVTDTERVRGYVDEIYVEAPTVGTMSVVTIVSSPGVGTSLTPTVLFTNGALTARDFARTRVTQTDAEGADLASLTVSERFLCQGGPVVLRVSQTSRVTGLTFRAWLKLGK